MAASTAGAQTSSKAGGTSQPSQTSQPSFSVPTLRTSVRIVDVTLVATRPDGSRVTDLRPSEIRVFDNGKLQTIASFDAMGNAAVSSGGKVNATASQGAQQAAAAAYPHSLILLLDALNTAWSHQVYVKRAVEHLLDSFPPGQQIAIFVLGDHLSLLHNFSSNPSELRDALRRFSPGQTVGGVASAASGPFSAEIPTQTANAGNPDAAQIGPRVTGGQSDEARYFQGQRTLQTLHALTAIARAVGNVPGQKDLFWVSSAFPFRVQGTRDVFDADLYYDQTKQMTRTLSSADLRLYPIDARGLTMNPHAAVNIDAMRMMADLTGGKAFYNNNDLSLEMRRALEDSSEGYMLTYAPNDFREDRSFHTIRLEVSRPGVELRYRPGYYAAASPPVQRIAATNNGGASRNAQNDLASTQRAAEQGDATAQFDMGIRYDQGLGVARDYAQAAVWWRKAADQGDANAQYDLGVLYAKGEGVPQDFAQAAVWFRKVADQGNPNAQYDLGQFYSKGQGLPQDDAQAAAWWRKAAEQGNARAQYNLGIAYARGQGVKRDFAEAYFWMDLAATGTVQEAARQGVGKARDAAASYLTAEELTQAQGRVREWMEKHPTKGNSE